MRNYLLFVFSFIFTATFSQKIDNTVSYRNINSNAYFRIHYENDYFAAYDQYYTQGICLEWANPLLKSNPINFILIKLLQSSLKFGLAFEHNGYTPTSIRSNSILYNDRPFAAVALIKSFSIATDTISKSRLSAILSLGVIGQAALGKEMQATIHGWIGDKQPLGWQYQIQNDLAVNYELNYEKLLLNYRNFFSLNTNLQLKAGTISDKVQAGFTFTLGKFNSPLITTIHRNDGLQWYVFSQPLINLVGYDATMQGGLFNRNRPYTLEATEVERWVVQNNFGAVFTFKKLYLEYHQTIISREFSQGTFHRWGGVKIGFYW